jgi:EAL domain-containing protein (putative c-di-GMP-specific phosphodiesterase class I)
LRPLAHWGEKTLVQSRRALFCRPRQGRQRAEFVDHPAVLERLREMGIDFAQGDLLHRSALIDEMRRDAPVEAAPSQDLQVAVLHA